MLHPCFLIFTLQRKSLQIFCKRLLLQCRCSHVEGEANKMVSSWRVVANTVCLLASQTPKAHRKRLCRITTHQYLSALLCFSVPLYLLAVEFQFNLLNSMFFVPFWIASCSLFHHHRSKERVGWEEIPLMSGNVSCWLLGLLTSTCHCLRARALPHHLAMDRLCLFLFNKWGEGGKQSPCACVLI